jgi:hypothetical protein
VAHILFWRKFANSVKSGCLSGELKAAGAIPGRASAGASAFAKATAGQAVPSYSKTDIPKSKTGRWRAVALILLNLFMIAHIIQWRLMGRTVSPIEPSETMYTLQNGFVNAGFIFFSLAILATLIFGRFVCGWGCHILALQDLCGWLLKKMGLQPKPFRSRLLVYVPLGAALYMFVWPVAYRLGQKEDFVLESAPAFHQGGSFPIKRGGIYLAGLQIKFVDDNLHQRRSRDRKKQSQ